MFDIEKAKHQDGDIHPNGKWVWSSSAAGGKGDWRTIKKNKVEVKKEPEDKSKKKEEPKVAAPEVKTPKDDKSKKTKSTYDAPKPKIAYVNKPEIPYEVPESWAITNRKGLRDTQERSVWRKKFADKKLFDDVKLIDIINRTSMQNPNLRHMAWEEAAARGIPESKLDISGTLKNKWENAASDYKLKHPDSGNEEEDLGSSYVSLIGDFPVDEFRKEFPDGDDGWKNPNDPRVKKAFNNLITLKNRQQYDALVDMWKREDPYYENVDDQLAALAIQLSSFIDSKDKKNGSAMFISTGGAGAGKTTTLGELLKASELHLYDPEVDPDPTASNIDAVNVAEDINSEKDLFNILHKYNGKIIIFDDKDKALVSGANKIVSAMKNIADSNYKQRIIPVEGGKSELFTGRLIFITNKTFDDLNSDEDHKAILSRADKNEVNFTLNENLEVLSRRYKTIGGRMEGFTKQEEQDFRQKVFDTIMNNLHRVDPAKFTVRKFTELLRGVVAAKNAEKKSKENADFEKLFGGANSNSIKWQNAIIRNLNKGEENLDIEKSNLQGVMSKLSPSAILKFKKMYKKDAKKFVEMFGEKFVDFLSSNDTEDVTEKAMIEDLNSGMSLEDAENILLG